MEKKHLLLISTLILFGANFALNSWPASAVIEKDGKNYWTIEEMEALSANFEQEISATCGDDFMCRDEFNMSLWERGEDYRAMSSFESMPLHITAVNPSKGTLRVIYYDQEKNMEHMGMYGNYPLLDLFVVRFDNGYYTTNASHAQMLRSGNIAPEVHPVLNETEIKNGPNWLIPNTEQEFAFEDATISDNIQNSLYIYYETALSAYGNIVDYSSCVASDEYHDGMECRLFFSQGGARYLPFAVENEDTPVIIEPATEKPTTENPATKESTTESSAADSKGESATKLEEIIPTTPNTGVGTCKTEADSPWWLVVSLIIGNFLAIWWLTPAKKPKKS